MKSVFFWCFLSGADRALPAGAGLQSLSPQLSSGKFEMLDNQQVPSAPHRVKNTGPEKIGNRK